MVPIQQLHLKAAFGAVQMLRWSVGRKTLRKKLTELVTTSVSLETLRVFLLIRLTHFSDERRIHFGFSRSLHHWNSNDRRRKAGNISFVEFYCDIISQSS